MNEIFIYKSFDEQPTRKMLNDQQIELLAYLAAPDDVALCGAEAPRGGWICTCCAGHPGAHFAHGIEDEPLAMWKDD